MSWRAEWLAYARFARAPRRLRGRTLDGAPWVARLLALATLTVLAGLVLDAAVQPLAAWAGATSVFPDRITPGLLFGALLYAPILEELLFRAGLRQADYTIGFGPLLLALAIAPWTRTTFVALAIAAAAIVAINRWLVWRVFRRPGARFRLGRRYVTHFGWIYWAYTLAFALAHTGNYDWNGARAVVAPLLVLPQLLIGISLGYIRLRDGLRSSLLMHFIVNACATAGMALSG